MNWRAKAESLRPTDRSSKVPRRQHEIGTPSVGAHYVNVVGALSRVAERIMRKPMPLPRRTSPFRGTTRPHQFRAHDELWTEDMLDDWMMAGLPADPVS